MSETDHSGKPSRLEQLLVLLVLGLGLRYWLFHPHEDLKRFFLFSLPLCVVVPFVRPLSRPLESGLDRLNKLCAAHRGWTALLVGLGVGADLLSMAWQTRGQLFLKLHDEHSYMIGARMLAHGRMWTAGYPADVRDFFDTFHVIVGRVYASMYFPGTALAAAPGVLLGLPYWLTPLLLCSAAGAIFYLVVADLFDPVRGLVAVVILLSLRWFAWTALSMMSDAPFLAAELMLLWAWLRWRKNHGGGWAVLIGAAAGYGAITRPIDMLCFAAAVGMAMAWELRRRPPILLRCAAIIVLGAAPFLALQLVQNIGVSGRWNQTAEGYYEAANYPAPMFGFYRFDPARVPQFACPPKQAFMQSWVVELYRNHTPARVLADWYPSRLESLLDVALGNRVLIVLVCLGLISLGDVRRLMLVGAAVLFLVAYLFHVFVLDQYLVPLIPTMICLALMGWDRLERTWPALRGGIRTAMVLLLLTLSISMMPQFDAAANPDIGQFAVEGQINDRLARMPRQAAVVLFRFNPLFTFHADPVYNDDAVRPDDAPIVRTNDLGAERDLQLIRYYARRQPDRVFYIYDLGAAPGTEPLSRALGTARELAGSDHSISIASP
jgi:hypothetical protein